MFHVEHNVAFPMKRFAETRAMGPWKEARGSGNRRSLR